MQSDFARIFNAVIFSTAASVALAVPTTVAARGTVAVSAARAVAVAPARIAPAPVAAPKPAPPAPTPVAAPKPAAPVIAPTPKPLTAAAVAAEHPAPPAQKMVDAAGGNGNNGNKGGGKVPTGGDNGKKLPPSNQPYHSEDHTFGYTYYNWLYARPTHSHYVYQPATASSVARDDVLTCMYNRLHHNGIDNGVIDRNLSHIRDLKIRFDSARMSERAVPVGSLTKFDGAVFQAYKDCTYDW